MGMLSESRQRFVKTALFSCFRFELPSQNRQLHRSPDFHHAHDHTSGDGHVSRDGSGASPFRTTTAYWPYRVSITASAMIALKYCSICCARFMAFNFSRMRGVASLSDNVATG